MAGIGKRWATLTIATCALCGALPSGASASAPRARVGAVPKLPSQARVTGAVRGTTRIQLTLSLASRDPLALQRLATAVSTPGSPQFRHYLNVSQFADRFGATDKQVAAVSAALRREGLKVGRPDANRLSLNASGTAEQVQHAFATRLARVRLSGGRVAYADRTTPTLPASVARDVDAVVGLNTTIRPEADQIAKPSRPTLADAAPAARSHVATGGPQPCATATSTAASQGGYTADKIAAAYDFSGLYGQGLNGTGQTIALYELETLNPADVAAYQACYGTAVPFSYVNVDHPKTTSTDDESALDADQLIGLAPGAKVIVYQAPDTVTAGVAEYSKIVSQDAARTISVSWGACESVMTDNHTDLSVVKAEGKLFQEAAVQGQSVVAATGDTGSSACYKDNGSEATAVQDPSSQPYATAVGGTSLFTRAANGQPAAWNPDASPAEPALQSVWNDGVITESNGQSVPSASTGGISTLWKMPGYQSKAAAGLDVLGTDSSGKPCKSTHCRQVPDVSADGDPETPYLIYSDGIWGPEGGTSAAAPLWAALTAIANQSPTCRGAALGFENPSLYKLAATAPGAINDVSAANPFSGRADNSALPSDTGLYPVGVGYDMTSGLGTPDAAKVAAALCGLRAPVYTVSLAAPHTLTVQQHIKTTLYVRGADSGKLALTYHGKGLPKGLKLSRKGVISGKASKLGRYSVSVTASDHATNTASLGFTLRVVKPFPKLTKVGLTGLSKRRPTLAFTVTRGHGSPKLRSVTVRLPKGLSFGRHGRGVHIHDGRHRVRFSFKRRHGALTLTFKAPQGKVRVTIGHGTLFATKKLAATARRQKKHSKAKVRVRINTTEKNRRTTRFAVRLRIKR